MNATQRRILLNAAAVFLVSALFVPWIVIEKERGTGTWHVKSEQAAGYHLLFLTPAAQPSTAYETFATHVDTERLGVEWASLALFVAILMLAFREQPESKAPPATVKAPPSAWPPPAPPGPKHEKGAL